VDARTLAASTTTVYERETEGEPVAVIVKVYVPARVATPVTAPVTELRLKPNGRAPAVTAYDET
jgi:hypothetical protein